MNMEMHTSQLSTVQLQVYLYAGFSLVSCANNPVNCVRSLAILLRYRVRGGIVYVRVRVCGMGFCMGYYATG